MMEKSPLVLDFVSESEGRSIIVRQTVARDGMCFRYAAGSLQADHKLALIAIRQNPLAIEFLPALKHNKELLCLLQIR